MLFGDFSLAQEVLDGKPMFLLLQASLRVMSKKKTRINAFRIIKAVILLSLLAWSPT